MSRTIDAVVLAAGKGTRMKSELPKVLHEIAGRPLLDYVLDTAAATGIDHTVVVVGHQASLVQEKCSREGIDVVLQEPQLGTGHAVQMAVPALRRGGYTVVLAGDVPLLTVGTLKRLVAGAMAGDAAAVILTCVVDDAGAYGRIVKNDQGQVQKIVEFADANAEEKAIGEYNTGVICYQTDRMIEALAELKTNNEQSEYYLTDTIGWFVERGLGVDAVATSDPDEVVGINTIDQLDEAARLLAKRG